MPEGKLSTDVIITITLAGLAVGQSVNISVTSLNYWISNEDFNTNNITIDHTGLAATINHNVADSILTLTVSDAAVAPEESFIVTFGETADYKWDSEEGSVTLAAVRSDSGASDTFELVINMGS